MVSYSDFMRFAKTNNVVERIFIKLAKTTFWAQIVWSLSDTEVYNLNMSVPDKEQAWNIIFANSNSMVVWVFSGHNSQSFLESAARQECVNVQHTDLLILRKRVWWLKSDLVPGSQEFPKRKRECMSFFWACMSESATLDDDTDRTSSSSFLLCARCTTQQVWNKPKTRQAFLRWHQITGRCPHSFLISNNDFSILCHHYDLCFFCFITQSKQQAYLSLPLFSLRKVNLTHLLQQPLSTEFNFIQITNNKPLKGSFC